MIPEPGIYTGKLRHRRFRPRRHEFTYNLFMAWLDIDRIPAMMAACPWTAYNRFNWASFDERDHFGDPKLSLRERVMRDARTHGLELPPGPVFLLTHLRYLGYCFNPISFFYCYDEAGRIHSILGEVHNTFGEIRNYWLTSENRQGENRQATGNAFRYVCPKTLHVSPFNPMNLDYEFVLTEPGQRLVAHMNTAEGSDKPFFDATLTLEHRAWTSRNLAAALAGYPLMTVQVIGAIHWEALRLWIKRVPVFTHPDRIESRVGEVTKQL
jgi:hypothetical protein